MWNSGVHKQRIFHVGPSPRETTDRQSRRVKAKSRANGAKRKSWILITKTQGNGTPGHRKSLLTSHGRSKVSAKKRTLVAARTCVVRSKMWHSR